MKQTLRNAVYHKDNTLRKRVELIKSFDNYQIEITSYTPEGYYSPAGSFTLMEFSEAVSANQYFDEIMIYNNLLKEA